MSYLVRRVASSALQIVAVALVSWLVFRWLPGDVWSEAALADPRRTPETIEKWRQHAASPAVSLTYGIPVTRLIWPRLGVTLRLAAIAWVAAWMLGLAAAMLWRSRAGGAAATVLSLLPEALSGSALLWLAVARGWRLDAAWIPVTILVLAIAPVIYLHAARGLTSARSGRDVLLAERRGVARAALWARYILPAAAHPLLALLGTTAAGVVGSSLVVEALTGQAGLGPLFLDAFQRRDYPVVQAVLLILAAVLTLVNLAGDLLLYRLDPRIRVTP